MRTFWSSSCVTCNYVCPLGLVVLADGCHNNVCVCTCCIPANTCPHFQHQDWTLREMWGLSVCAAASPLAATFYLTRSLKHSILAWWYWIHHMLKSRWCLEMYVVPPCPSRNPCLEKGRTSCILYYLYVDVMHNSLTSKVYTTYSFAACKCRFTNWVICVQESTCTPAQQPDRVCRAQTKGAALFSLGGSAALRLSCNSRPMASSDKNLGGVRSTRFGTPETNIKWLHVGRAAEPQSKKQTSTCILPVPCVLS